MRKRKSKGSSMIMVIAIFGILSILGVSMLGATTASYKMRIAENKKMKNLYAAESGIDLAYIRLTTEINNALNNGLIESEKVNDKSQKETTFNDTYFKYIRDNLNESTNTVSDKYISDGKEVEVVCKVVNKGSITDSNPNGILTDDIGEKIATLTSTYEEDGKERIVSVSYTLEVPPYNVVSNNELSNVYKYSFATDGDLYIENNKELEMYGDVWVKGTMAKAGESVPLNRKYNGGIIMKNNEDVELSGQLNTASNISGINSEMEIEIEDDVDDEDYIEGQKCDIYAENMYIGKDEIGIDSGVEVDGEDINVHLANDLVIDADKADITIKNFYGFNDVNVANYDGKEVRGSSSIIINSMEWPKKRQGSYDSDDTLGLKITDEAYIMGSAYINTKTPYQTGESVALKGNYEAYTAPKDGDYDASQYEYLEPLVLLKMEQQDKIEHFVTYANDTQNKNIRKSGISLPRNTVTAAAYISSDKKAYKDTYSTDHSAKLKELKQLYVKEVYNMGHGENEDYNDKDFYLGEPSKTVSNQIDWEVVKELQNNQPYYVEKVDGVNVIIAYGESGSNNSVKIVEERSGNKKFNTMYVNGLKVSFSNDKNKPNYEMKSEELYLVVTNGKVNIESISKQLKCKIISSGDIAIRNCTGDLELGTMNDISDAIVNSAILRPIFGGDSSESEVVTVDKLITKEKWTLVK